jgi:Flp pilus assembly protein CpaB
MQNKLFATRQGTIVVGVIAAVIAAIALIVYLNHYRSSVDNNAMSPVLVTKTYIAKGTPGNFVKSNEAYTVSHVAKSALQPGALVDPSALDGRIATTNIGVNQQLTEADFGPATGSLSEQLAPPKRAVVIPLGAPQQVGGQISADSHVDVFATVNNKVTQILQNMSVLGVNGGNVTLLATPQQAGILIWASENANPWMVLRPVIATSTIPRPVGGGG